MFYWQNKKNTSTFRLKNESYLELCCITKRLFQAFTVYLKKTTTKNQMATRASVCSALLKRFRSKDDFLLHLVTVDETWVHYYEPENKAQSRQWVGPGSPRPKKFKTQPSAGKVMATVFWDAKGIIMLDFFAKRRTITGVYYANLLDQLRTAISETL